MSNNTPMLYAFSESEFQSRCSDAEIIYSATVELPQYPNDRGAVEYLLIQGIPQAMERYYQLRKAGYSPLPESSPLETAMAVGYMVSLYLIKPPAQQKRELAEIYARIKIDYEQSLEQLLEAEVERQVQIAVDAAERKRLEDEQAAQNEIAERVRTELAESRTALRAQLIGAGKLNAAGEAQ